MFFEIISIYLDVRAKPNGKVREPDHTGGVAGESNELGFIEVFRDISESLKIIHSNITKEFCLRKPMKGTFMHTLKK